jgi:hypothetical protein
MAAARTKPKANCPTFWHESISNVPRLDRGAEERLDRLLNGMNKEAGSVGFFSDLEISRALCHIKVV